MHSHLRDDEHRDPTYPSAAGPGFPGPAVPLTVLVWSPAEEAGVEPSLLGGKGANLERLTRAGFDVPPWLCVLTPGLDLALRRAGRREEVRETLRAVSAAGFAADTEEVTRLATGLQDLVHGLDVPEAIRAPLLQGWPRLADGYPVAVRSSAEGEDGARFSGAGLYESVLGVTGEEALFQALRTVWASYFSARALYHRAAHPAGDPGTVRIAVVVQRMVDCRASGVAFTADPVSGDLGTMVIQSTFGLGEGLVDGRTGGDELRVRRNPFALERRVVFKEKRLVARDGALVEEALEPQERRASSLTEEETRELAGIAGKIETAFRRPQDVEWALARDGRFRILQTRPITTLPELGPAAGHRRVWSVESWTENYPGVTLPMTYSVVRRMDRIGLQALARYLGVSEETVRRHPEVFSGFLGYVRGRLVSDGMVGRKLLRLVPGSRFQPVLLLRLFGADGARAAEILPPVSRRRRWLAELPALLRLAGRIVRSFRTIRGDMDRLLAETRAFHEEVEDLPFGEMSPEALLEIAEKAEARFVWRWHLAMLNGIFLKACHGALGRLCRSWLGDASGSLAHRLLLGAETEQRVILGRMEALAGLFHESGDLRRRLLEGDLGELAEDVAYDPDLAGVRQKVEAFLQDYPFKGRSEMKLEGVTYRQEPVLLYRALREMVRGAGAGGDEARPPRGSSAEEQRREAERQAEKALRRTPLRWWRRPVFRWLLAKTRALDEHREAVKMMRLRLVGDYRELLGAVGAHLEAEGILLDRRDLLYLGFEELADYVRGSALSPRLDWLVEGRRQEIAALGQGTVAPPADAFETTGLVYHKNVHGSAAARRQREGAGTAREPRNAMIQGIGCSGGRAEGPVVLASSPEDVESLAGKILLVPRIHTDWVPYFPSLAGLLVEQGETLAHAMTVAREMGLPTVTGLPGLSSLLVAGQVVSLDGTNGTVQLHPGVTGTVPKTVAV